jgi:hypothetical protein
MGGCLLDGNVTSNVDPGAAALTPDRPHRVGKGGDDPVVPIPRSMVGAVLSTSGEAAQSAHGEHDQQCGRG